MSEHADEESEHYEVLVVAPEFREQIRADRQQQKREDLPEEWFWNRFRVYAWATAQARQRQGRE